MDIRFIAQEEIDQLKWNSCVHYANNGSPFGYMWYLDAVAEEWDGLVEGDYESVMPIIWKTKGWFKQEVLYQPSLIRASAIYSVHVLSIKRIQSFFEAIPKRFKKIELALNEQHTNLGDDFLYKKTTKTNHLLWLETPYEELLAAYSEELKVALDEAADQQFRPINDIKTENFVDFYRKHQPNANNLGRNYHAMHRIIYNALHRGIGALVGVQDDKLNLVAANFFLFSHGKILSLFPSYTDDKQGKLAIKFLMDLFIRGNAGRSMLLDFNSNTLLEATTFGATAHDYYYIMDTIKPNM